MRLFKFVFFGFFIFTLTNPLQAQVTVQGTVTDSLHKPISNVNVYATGPDSISIESFSYTNTKGKFSLQLKLDQPHLLHVSSLGYGKQIIAIPAFSAPDTLQKPITLHSKAFKLKEMVVKSRQSAIITKKDTIIFNASSFERGNEETVEDILKQLPGVQVDASGKIKVNGKSVSKVMIGDDDLFGYNYQLLTKNLTADAIKNVSVYKHYHENAALQGVSKSEETVLNLALKDDFKVDLFGTLKGYWDLDDHYQGDANLISITKKFKGYLFENANNVGKSPVGNIYSLLSSSGSLPFNSSTTLGSGAGGSSFISTNAQRVSHLNRPRYLDNQASFHAFGGIYNPTKKLKIKGVGYFLPSNRQISQRSITQYDPTLDVQNMVERETTNKHIRAGLGQLTATYTASKKANLKYVGKFNAFPETDRTGRRFNSRPLDTRLQTHDRAWDQRIEFTRKVAPKKAYRLRARYKNESIRQHFGVNPALTGGAFAIDSAATLRQQTHSNGSYIGTDFKYWSKKPNHLFSVRAGGERTGNRLSNHIAGQPAYINGHFWDQYRAFSSITYRQTFTPHLKGHARLTGNYQQNRTNVLAKVDNHLFYASPEVGLEYKFTDKQQVQTQYNFNQTLPDFHTLYNGPRLTGYRSIEDGTDDFTLLPSNVFTALYQFGNWEDNFVFNASFNFLKSNERYASASTVTPTYTFSGYRLDRDLQSISSGFGVNEFVPFLQSNLQLHYKFNRSSFTSFFNNTANALTSTMHQIDFSARTVFVGAFNASGGLTYNYSNYKNTTGNSLRNTHYVSAYVNMFIKIGKKFNATIKDNYYSIPRSGSYQFLDAKLDYKFIEDKLELFADATNLLDKHSFQTIYLGDYQRSEQRNVLNRRYVLFGLKFSFR